MRQLQAFSNGRFYERCHFPPMIVLFISLLAYLLFTCDNDGIALGWHMTFRTFASAFI